MISINALEWILPVVNVHRRVPNWPLIAKKRFIDTTFGKFPICCERSPNPEHVTVHGPTQATMLNPDALISALKATTQLVNYEVAPYRYPPKHPFTLLQQGLTLLPVCIAPEYRIEVEISGLSFQAESVAFEAASERLGADYLMGIEAYTRDYTIRHCQDHSATVNFMWDGTLEEVAEERTLRLTISSVDRKQFVALLRQATKALQEMFDAEQELEEFVLSEEGAAQIEAAVANLGI